MLVGDPLSEAGSEIGAVIAVPAVDSSEFIRHREYPLSGNGTKSVIASICDSKPSVIECATVALVGSDITVPGTSSSLNFRLRLRNTNQPLLHDDSSQVSGDSAEIP
eukprot:41237_1